MTAAIALALLVRQGPPPTLPTGTSPAFARLALAVEAKLVAGDIPGAREAARGLPVRTPKIAWKNLDLLPPSLLSSREAGLKRSVAAWARRAVGFAPEPASGPADLTIDFGKVLSDGPTGLPQTTTVEAGPPFQATIGLTRGKPGSDVRPEDLTVEIAYALGRYLGVNETPFPGSAMHRDPRPGLVATMPQTFDQEVAAGNLDLADRLRAAIEAGKPTGLTVPSVKLGRPTLDLGEFPQGKVIQTYIPLENVGVGPLDYRIIPDCSCFSIPRPERIAPLGSARATILINTIESLGRQDKRLLLLTNDPLQPSIEIPVTFYSRPAYRMFRPEGDAVVVPEKGGTYEIFMYANPGSTVKPVSLGWEGIDAKVLPIETWSGNLADPELGEGPLPRQGWRFRVQISPKLLPGRTPGTLVVRTNSSMFGTLRYSLYAQKGIVPLQESVYFGDMVAGSRATATISRPNQPFKILSVDSGALATTWRDRKGGWEYDVEFEYKGGSPKGDYLAPIKIHTDDPKQPIIEVMLNGNVK